VRFFSYTIYNAEYLPASDGIDQMLPQLRSLVDRGYSIAIFPEGTRSKDGSILRFHKGAFHIAQELNVDVLPLVIYGSGRVLPKHAYMMNKGAIHLEIDRRISPTEMLSYGPTLQAQAQAMRQYYKLRYSEIADKLDQNA
jgi:1-acyl-sn-glycerol-3-phosphate acyltransferase